MPGVVQLDVLSLHGLSVTAVPAGLVCIDSLKVSETVVLVPMPVAPLMGANDETVGAVASAVALTVLVATPFPPLGERPVIW